MALRGQVLFKRLYMTAAALQSAHPCAAVVALTSQKVDLLMPDGPMSPAVCAAVGRGKHAWAKQAPRLPVWLAKTFLHRFTTFSFAWWQTVRGGRAAARGAVQRLRLLAVLARGSTLLAATPSGA